MCEFVAAKRRQGEHREAGSRDFSVGAGADYLVIGRSITQADDPARAAQEIADEISTAQSNRSMV